MNYLHYNFLVKKWVSYLTVNKEAIRSWLIFERKTILIKGILYFDIGAMIFFWLECYTGMLILNRKMKAFMATINKLVYACVQTCACKD